MDGSLRPGVGRSKGAGSPELLVAAQFVFHGRVGGAEHMLYNVLRGLERGGVDLGVLCATRANLDPAFVDEFDRALPGVFTECGGGQGSRFIAEQRACLRAGLRSAAILFPNYFVPPVVPRRLGRVVSVLHDMQFRRYPANFTAKKRTWLAAAQGFALRRSDAVVAISEFVRGDILSQYGRRFERKVRVIPNPISWDRFGTVGAGRMIPQPYILSVAAGYAHKNLDVLVRAFAEVAARDRDVHLVLCGQDYAGLRGVSGSRRGVADLAADLGIADRVHVTGYIDDHTLGRWYRHAAMFAFPSLYEGFGMPPVEALGFGLPTLTTSLTALPETTMGLAQTVTDATSPSEWASRITEILRNTAEAAPAPADVTRLRAHYSPDCIGRLYAEACLG